MIKKVYDIIYLRLGEGFMFNIGILIFENVEELDFIGPFEVLCYVNKIKPEGTNVMLVSSEELIIRGYNGLRFFADYTIDNCPKLDVLVVPGGQGRNISMRDEKLLIFLKNRYNELKYLSSVCTGALILGAAGLLKDKVATTHHTAFDELSKMGITVRNTKVVEDGNVITGGGVSSGIDVGLYLLSKLFNEAIAQEVADKIEYSWNRL
jgi:cyclohexyl-isocyanide hydratase